MQFDEFFTEQILRPRLQGGVLVVYDPDRRYRVCCGVMAGHSAGKIRFVDATESSIESREAALRALRDLAIKPVAPIDAVLVYVPARRPLTDEEKQRDPFALYAECGNVFPNGDGDDYLSLCLRARPDHQTEVRRIFAENPSPEFALIDAIGSGMGWPQLRTTLDVQGPNEILLALLAPTEPQKRALRGPTGWNEEARRFLKATLGLDLRTRSVALEPLSDELWRYLLFSEFAFDLPEPLPASLQGVPCAPVEARPLVESLCETLRGLDRTKPLYRTQASAIQSDLELPARCQHIADLGDRDTFPFEERTFLCRAIEGVTTNDPDRTRAALTRHSRSIWVATEESQAQWSLLSAASALITACFDAEPQLTGASVRDMPTLIDLYTGSLRDVDRLQREFEQAVSEYLDTDGLLTGVVQQARASYGAFAGKVEQVFLRLLESGGWPATGHPANADTFERYVAPLLSNRGAKVAYFLVDALRYELGGALEKLLSEDTPVELKTACAQLPTITPVGMASLCPGGSEDLTLSIAGTDLVPKRGGQPVTNVAQRMDVFRRLYGDRFTECLLSDFVRGQVSLPPTADLLVLRSVEIDSHLENNPETALGLVPVTLKHIRYALHKLKGLGFHTAVIATDHGFFLNAHAGSGDVCAKPTGGNWSVNTHDRMLLGNGNADSHNLVLPADKLGIRGDVAHAALPRSMAPYRDGHVYFHGGASLPEAIVPVLIVRFDGGNARESGAVKIELTYKNGAKRVTTRNPVIEISLSTDDIFAADTRREILLEAQKSDGTVIGEPRPGGEVNPATNTIVLENGQRKAITLRMNEGFEGKFTVKALDPVTLSAHATLNLETDYAV
jgi:hypothetical protein